MGVGDSLEAAYTLQGPIPSGTWHLTGDGIVISPVDIRYEIVWRHGSDTTLATVEHHFDELTGAAHFDATQFETDSPGIAAAAQAGDQLILRFTATGGADGGAGSSFIPNGDGASAHGRIPSLIFPK